MWGEVIPPDSEQNGNKGGIRSGVQGGWVKGENGGGARRGGMRSVSSEKRMGGTENGENPFSDGGVPD